MIYASGREKGKDYKKNICKRSGGGFSGGWEKSLAITDWQNKILINKYLS